MSKELFIDGEWDVRDWGVDASFGCYPHIWFTFAYLPKIGYKLDYGIIKKNLGICAAAPEMYQMLEYLADGIRWGGIEHTSRSLADEIEKVLKKARGEV